MEIFHDAYKLCEGPKNPHRRIFLNRKSFYQRNIKNIDKLTEILKRYDFESIYAEDLSYEQQVAMFRETKYFVGIHGAGLTNLLFSDIQSLRVLEIFSESLVHASFYRFLEMLGVAHYDAITGTPFDINWNFTVDETQFESQIKTLISK
jgi:capsular polysaccharide biosynthesis protein